jgi:hypothetical protein
MLSISFELIGDYDRPPQNITCIPEVFTYNARLAAMYVQRLVHRFLTPSVSDITSF